MSDAFDLVEVPDQGGDTCQVYLGNSVVVVKHLTRGAMTAMHYTAKQAQALSAALTRAAEMLPPVAVIPDVQGTWLKDCNGNLWRRDAVGWDTPGSPMRKTFAALLQGYAPLVEVEIVEKE